MRASTVGTRDLQFSAADFANCITPHGRRGRGPELLLDAKTFFQTNLRDPATPGERVDAMLMVCVSTQTFTNRDTRTQRGEPLAQSHTAN